MRHHSLVILATLVVWALPSLPANALVYAAADFETRPEQLPDDFPYWEHVTQRRYEGPSVIYLGQGWAMTAKHVGAGEIFLKGEIMLPDSGSRRTMLNVDGSAADLMVFPLQVEQEIPFLPLLPLATEPPQPGEEGLLIGFGRGNRERHRAAPEAGGHLVVPWDTPGEKRWGTNRISSPPSWLFQGSWLTRVIAMRFDAPDDPLATEFEAHAAVGDSGGAIFVRRDGEWQLAGVITSVAANAHQSVAKSARYGDHLYAADVSSYRREIVRWTRPSCANEEDDDGDGDIDYPDDLGCTSLADRDEREVSSLRIDSAWTRWLAAVSLAVLAGLWVTGQTPRGRPVSGEPKRPAR